MMTTIKNIREKCIILGLALIISSSFFCNASTHSNNLYFFPDGASVDQFWKLGNDKLHSLWSKMQFGFYSIWSKSWKLPEHYGTISFKALTNDFIFVGATKINPLSVFNSGEDLYLKMILPENFYEFIIGPGFSLLFRGGFLQEDALLKFTYKGIPIDPNTGNFIIKLIDYKIIFYRENNKDFIAMYALNPVTETWTRIMKYHAQEFEQSKRWFSLSSFYGNTFFESVEVSGSTTLPVTFPAPLNPVPVP